MNVDTAARQRFLEEYRQIRYAEGRGSEDPEYYRALPFEDLSRRNAAMWQMRAKTYRYFERRILAPLEMAAGQPLDIMDLGAGNCWLSYRLSLRRHRVCAVDIFLDPRDGLAAARHYDAKFPVVGAEFDHLPFPSSSFDLAVFNSSVHYSTDYSTTLAEALRCLRPGGRVVILDSPLYRERAHGEQMIAERHAQFEKRYGFRSDSVPSIEFLDKPRMRELADSLHLRWRVHRPWYGWSWHLRPLKAWFARRRPPSRFWIFIARADQP
ncbi:MAG TPA: class I SAM-dependent methyltransferase [Bryobacteraceae bacterium]|nr:class I SAM-dependent methyltransferase [Bryobacteraceae bacterium]